MYILENRDGQLEIIRFCCIESELSKRTSCWKEKERRPVPEAHVRIELPALLILYILFSECGSYYYYCRLLHRLQRRTLQQLRTTVAVAFQSAVERAWSSFPPGSGNSGNNEGAAYTVSCSKIRLQAPPRYLQRVQSSSTLRSFRPCFLFCRRPTWCQIRSPTTWLEASVSCKTCTGLRMGNNLRGLQYYFQADLERYHFQHSLTSATLWSAQKFLI